MKFFIVFLTTMTHSTQALTLTYDINSLLHRDYVDHIRVCTSSGRHCSVMINIVTFPLAQPNMLTTTP